MEQDPVQWMRDILKYDLTPWQEMVIRRLFREPTNAIEVGCPSDEDRYDLIALLATYFFWTRRPSRTVMVGHWRSREAVWRQIQSLMTQAPTPDILKWGREHVSVVGREYEWEILQRTVAPRSLEGFRGPLDGQNLLLLLVDISLDDELGKIAVSALRCEQNYLCAILS